MKRSKKYFVFAHSMDSISTIRYLPIIRLIPRETSKETPRISSNGSTQRASGSKSLCKGCNFIILAAKLLTERGEFDQLFEWQHLDNFLLFAIFASSLKIMCHLCFYE